MTDALSVAVRRLDGSISIEDLSRDWTLDRSDRDEVLTARGDQNQIRFALDTCSLRATGAFIIDWQKVPVVVINHLARQLSIRAQEEVPSNPRRTTIANYRLRIRAHLGYVAFSSEYEAALDDVLMHRAHEGAPKDVLRVVAHSWLHERRVVRPGPTTIDRVVVAVHTRAESAVIAELAGAVPKSIRNSIDTNLLEVGDDEATSVLFALRKSAKSAKANNIIEQLEQVADVERVPLIALDLPSSATPPRLSALAEEMKRYNAWELRRMVPSRRYALVTAFLLTVRARLLDESVLMTDNYITGMCTRAQKRHQVALAQKRQESSKATARVLRSVRTAIEAGLSPDVDLTIGDAWETAIGGREGATTFLKVVADAERVQHREQHGYRDEVCAAYGPLRRFLPRVMHLPLRAEPGAESILEAIDIVRRLDAGTLKKVPEGAPYDFVPKKWRTGLLRRKHVTNRRLWETSLAIAIRDGLRKGDLYVEGSKQHASFSELIYSTEQWERRRDDAYRELKLPRDPNVVVDALCEQFRGAAQRLAVGLDENPYASIKDGQLRLRTEKAREVTAGAVKLRALLQGSLPNPVRLERVLLDVDNWCQFSASFRQARGTRQKPSRRAAILAALVAHGTNLGVSGMRASTEEFEPGEIERTSRQCVRPSTMRAANRHIVNYHASLSISRAWGDGSRSSSDGQRFAIAGDSLLGSYYPRHFGYYEQAVNVYTHTSDLHSVFGTRVISCGGSRESLFVLDAFLENDTIIDPQEHNTDSHGATIALFGMCHLLSLQLHPRIANLKKVTLYKPRKSTPVGALEPLFNKNDTINLELIRSQWDALVRVAASLRHQTAPAHVVLQRMSTNTKSKLSLALAELGKLVRTIFVMRYLHEPEMRAAIRRQLNRTEGRHGLAKYLFRGSQGTFTTSDAEQLTAKATALSVLSNAIVCWNMVQYQRALAELRPGEPVDLDSMSHVSPMVFGHVNAQGMYRFEAP